MDYPPSIVWMTAEDQQAPIFTTRFSEFSPDSQVREPLLVVGGGLDDMALPGFNIMIANTKVVDQILDCIWVILRSDILFNFPKLLYNDRLPTNIIPY
jgi:hypothetical protein